MHSRSYRYWATLACFLLIIASIHYIPAAHPKSALAAGTPCIDNGPTGGAYVAHVCFTTPADGAVLSASPATISVAVSAASGTLPVISRVKFYFTITTSTSHSEILSDFASPYTMQLPTTRWVKGNYRLEATVEFADGYTTTTYALLMITLNNGVNV